MKLSQKPPKVYKRYKVLVDGNKELEKAEENNSKLKEAIKAIDEKIPIKEKELVWANLSQQSKLAKACSRVNYNKSDQLDDAGKLTKMLGERVNMHKTMVGKGDDRVTAIQINLGSVDTYAKESTSAWLDKAKESSAKPIADT